MVLFEVELSLVFLGPISDFLKQWLVLVWDANGRGFGGGGSQLFGGPCGWNVTIGFLIIIRNLYIRSIEELEIGVYGGIYL